MFNKVAFENAAMQTDFKHEFADSKIVPAEKLPNPMSSPYQTLIQADNQVSINCDSYAFLNGKKQGEYEQGQLDKIELPAKNNRIKVTGTH
jgi:hypothetical protein